MITIEDVAEDVQLLPLPLVADLARGPHAGHGMCRICTVLEQLHPNVRSHVREAAERIRAWHEIDLGDIITAYTGTFTNEGRPDREQIAAAGEAVGTARDADETALRQLAGALSYARCIIVYMAAGWRP